MPHSEHPSPSPATTHSFTSPTQEHTFAALLFDMDGTLIDSTKAIEHYWRDLGTQIGVDGDFILQTSHGRRSVDVLAIHAPHLATWEHVCAAEAEIPRRFASEGMEIPGARGVLEGVARTGAKWAVVTSGTRGLVEGWMGVMGLERPGVLVTAEEVEKGKPDPSGYQLGLRRLGLEGKVDGGKVVVFEDAPAGVRAGKAAGFKVVGLATTHRVEQLREAGVDWIVRDMSSVCVADIDAKTGEVRVEIRDALID